MSGGPPGVREGPREHNRSHRGIVQQLNVSGPPIMLLKGVVSRSLSVDEHDVLTLASGRPSSGESDIMRDETDADR